MHSPPTRILPPIAAARDRKEWPWKQNFKCSPYRAEPFASSPSIKRPSLLKPRSKSTEPDTNYLPKLQPPRSKSSLDLNSALSTDAANESMSSKELRSLLSYVSGLFSSFFAMTINQRTICCRAERTLGRPNKNTMLTSFSRRNGPFLSYSTPAATTTAATTASAATDVILTYFASGKCSGCRRR
jgi:hypothetical protein